MALAPDVLKALGEISTPTVANAIEAFDVRPRDAGFMRPEVRCLFPELPPTVGYAVTAKISAARPGTAGDPSRAAYWDYILTVPGPRVVVVQDLDPEPVGALWGEVNANVHLALGCIGAVTDGGVRDLEEVAALGFAFFAPHVLVSHAYVHLVEFGTPVRVGGLEVASGDLIHADRHGVLTVPEGVAPGIPEAAARVADREAAIIAACRMQPFDLARLKAVFG